MLARVLHGGVSKLNPGHAVHDRHRPAELLLLLLLLLLLWQERQALQLLLLLLW
jgi:hypothetical protein